MDELDRLIEHECIEKYIHSFQEEYKRDYEMEQYERDLHYYLGR